MHQVQDINNIFLVNILVHVLIAIGGLKSIAGELVVYP
jgi:hypothetical protein